MATTELIETRPRPQVVTHTVPRKRRAWIEWVTTTDHKKIGIMYMYLTFAFFIIGGVEALLMRIQLGAPDNTFLTPERYNELFTLHGTTMIFLFVIPVMAGFANYVLPLMIGARDMAFPRINAWSFWMLLFGGLVLYASLFFNAPQAGWTSYPPLSSIQYSKDGGIDAWIIALHLIGLASILGGINFIATIHNMRAPGMGWSRLPLFGWAMLVYSYLIVIATPALAAALLMLLTDRHYGTHFFIPTVPGSGIREGSALLWQHAFWFYSHPAVYIMVLPAFGIVSEVLPVFSRKPIFGYKAIAASTVAIAFLGMLVWAHHMFATPIATVVLVFFMISSMMIAVPTGIKLINWIATLWQGTIEFTVPLMFCCGLIGTFVIGGISGVILAMFPVQLGAQRHLLRRRTHPLCAVRGIRLRRVRGPLLLVPEDVGEDDVPAPRALVLLDDPRRLQRHLPGAALARALGHAPARLRVSGQRRLDDLQPDLDGRVVHPRVRDPADVHQRRALTAHRPRRRPRSVEGQHARVVHHLAAATEQLRRDPARALGGADEGHPPRDRA